MIKYSSAAAARPDAAPREREAALTDLERARIAWEALAAHLAEHDVIGDLDLTVLGEHLYNNTFLPLSESPQGKES